MNLYGQAQLTKTITDQKNIERNYWRIFSELEEANKKIKTLEAENKKLKESAKKVPKKNILTSTSADIFSSDD